MPRRGPATERRQEPRQKRKGNVDSSVTFRWDEPDPDDRETVVVLALDSLGGATTVCLTQAELATKERLELHRSGWAARFEKRDLVLKTQRS